MGIDRPKARLRTFPPELKKRLPIASANLTRDTLWASFTQALILFAQLVTFFALSRTLGPREYGFYAGVQGIDAILTTLFVTWTGMVAMQEFVAGQRDKGSMIGSVLGWGAGFSAAALAASAVLGALLVPELSVWIVVAFVAADAVGTALMAFAAGIVQARFHFRASAPPRNYLVAGKMLVVLALWSASSVTLAWVAVGQLVVTLGAGIGAACWAYRKVGIRVRFGRPQLRDLKLGSLYAVGLGSLSIQEDSDKTLLVSFGHPTAGGEYAAGYRVVQLAFLPLHALLNASHQDFLKPDREPGAHLRRALRFTRPSVAYGLVVSLLLVAAAPIPAHLLGAGYGSATNMIRALAPLIFLRALSLFPVNALLGLGRNGVRTIVMLIGAGVNLALNCTLIPRLSWIGATIGTVGSEIALAAAAWFALVVLQRSADRPPGRHRASVSQSRWSPGGALAGSNGQPVEDGSRRDGPVPGSGPQRDQSCAEVVTERRGADRAPR